MNVIGIDFETYYDKEYSLSKMTTQEYVRNFQFEVICVAVQIGSGKHHFTGNMHDTGRWLQQFDWGNAMMVAHNIAFDGAILAWHFNIRPRYYFCSMMASRPFFVPFIKGGRMSLAKVSEYFSLPPKGTAVTRAIGMRRTDFTPYDMKNYLEYCIHDTELCLSIAKRALRLLPRDEVRLIDLNARKFIEPVFELDRPRLETALARHVLEKAAILKRAGLESRDLLMSNDKFGIALKLMGVDPPTKISPRTGKVAYAFAKTDPAMKALLDHPREDVSTIVAARMAHKSTITETRLRRFIQVSKTGEAFSVPLVYYAAHTGRLGGGDKMNLQNLNRGSEIRKALCAPPGFRVVVGDLSQIEARLVAALAGQMDMVEAFAQGRDLYCEFGSRLFGRTITKDDVAERFLSKTSVLGCFSKDTQVLTNTGVKPITDVLATDLVWDGESWVEHSGVLAQGRKEVAYRYGVGATLDHEVLTGAGWVAWHKVHGDRYLLQRAVSRASLPPRVPPLGDARAFMAANYGSTLVPTFDIANAGPRHRFTVITDTGPIIVHNCQYGTGGAKYHTTVTGSPYASVDITEAEAYRIVELYRSTYYKIPELWKEAGSWLKYMEGAKPGPHEGITMVYGPLTIHTNFKHLGPAIELPNGMPIFYPQLQEGADRNFQYMSRRGWNKIYGAAVVENVAQGLARIVISEAELYLASKGYNAASQVHDELIYIIPEQHAEKFATVLEAVLSRPVAWMPDLPVAAEVGIGDNYGDAK